MLSNYLASNDEFGVYVTLEETTESHLKNMGALNIKLPENLMISDYTDIREKFEHKGSGPEIIELLISMIDYFKKKEGDKFTCMGLDSLNALYSLIDTTDLRIRMFHFFKYLREKEITTFSIMEIPEFGKLPDYIGSEGFLVDGIIRTGDIETQHDVMIYMQVKKMRATEHSRKKHLMEISSKGLSILGPIVE